MQGSLVWENWMSFLRIASISLSSFFRYFLYYLVALCFQIHNSCEIHLNLSLVFVLLKLDNRSLLKNPRYHVLSRSWAWFWATLIGISKYPVTQSSIFLRSYIFSYIHSAWNNLSSVWTMLLLNLKLNLCLQFILCIAHISLVFFFNCLDSAIKSLLLIFDQNLFLLKSFW